MKKVKTVNTDEWLGFTNWDTKECHLWLMNTQKYYKAVLEQVRKGIRGNELVNFVKNTFNDRLQPFNKKNVNFKEVTEDFIRYYNDDVAPYENK